MLVLLQRRFGMTAVNVFLTQPVYATARLRPLYVAEIEQRAAGWFPPSAA
ncbi:MAG: hypothetical protein IAE79_23490 [Anaerolinea sp.]|nr:hypothetical protein [Anaerolinea sp.]